MRISMEKLYCIIKSGEESISYSFPKQEGGCIESFDLTIFRENKNIEFTFYKPKYKNGRVIDEELRLIQDSSGYMYIEKRDDENIQLYKVELIGTRPLKEEEKYW